MTREPGEIDRRQPLTPGAISSRMCTVIISSAASTMASMLGLSTM